MGAVRITRRPVTADAIFTPGPAETWACIFAARREKSGLTADHITSRISRPDRDNLRSPRRATPSALAARARRRLPARVPATAGLPPAGRRADLRARRRRYVAPPAQSDRKYYDCFTRCNVPAAAPPDSPAAVAAAAVRRGGKDGGGRRRRNYSDSSPNVITSPQTGHDNSLTPPCRNRWIARSACPCNAASAPSSSCDSDGSPPG